MIEFWREGLPVMFESSSMLGVSSPATFAASQALLNAENLAAVTLSQIVKGGAPIIYSTNTTVLDLRGNTFTVSYASPEWVIGWVLTAQLADYYGLPTFGSGGCTDSKCVDAQAGAEATATALMCGLAGINLVQCCGTMAHGTAGSMEMAVIADEIAAYVRHVLRPVQVNAETLAFDLIKKIGPAGQFLCEKSTREFARREIYVPKLFNKEPYQRWVSKGKKDLRATASDRVRHILDTHHPERLPSEVRDNISRIVREGNAKGGTNSRLLS
jgi:trimethylamine--corrinoid protein Co-methyltransferase